MVQARPGLPQTQGLPHSEDKLHEGPVSLRRCVYIVYISLSFIVTVSGKNKDLARFLAECEAELGKSRQRESEMYQAMFKLQTGAE